MQRKKQGLSQLRKKLFELSHFTPEELDPFLSNHRLVKGTVYTLRRKCSKASCRCASGQRHETVVLTASVAGKTRLWTIPEEKIDELRQRTEGYRQFRKARTTFIRNCEHRQAEMLRVIDSMGRIRTRKP